MVRDLGLYADPPPARTAVKDPPVTRARAQAACGTLSPWTPLIRPRCS